MQKNTFSLAFIKKKPYLCMIFMFTISKHHRKKAIKKEKERGEREVIKEGKREVAKEAEQRRQNKGERRTTKDKRQEIRRKNKE